MKIKKLRIVWVISSLFNMIFKRRVIRNILRGRHYTNDIKWIKKKHFFRYTLDPNDRVITITIKNTLDIKNEVRLFGAVTFPFFNVVNPGTEIKVLENSYDTLKASLLTTTFFVDKIKIIVKDKKQLFNPMWIESHGFCGCIRRRLFLPINFISARQEFTEIIELSSPQILLKLDKSIVFSFGLNPKEEMTLVLESFAIKSGDELFFNLAEKYNWKPTNCDNILNPIIKHFRS